MGSSSVWFDRIWRYLTTEMESEWPEESRATFVLWMISIIVDPLALYVPSIKDGDHRKTLDFDGTLLVIISIIYFLILGLKLTIYWNKYNTKIFRQPKLWLACIVGAPLVPILANGLLLILLLHKSTDEITASAFSPGVFIFLILYLLRISGIYRLFVATALRESPVLRILNNIVLFLYGGSLFGGLWYFFAVWRKMQCWYGACKSVNGCEYQNRNFTMRTTTTRNLGFLNEFCLNETRHTPNDMGIFKDAFLSKIVDNTTDGPKKWLYSFRWGVQVLSGFGQNLEVSKVAWENILVIVIAVYGMATFTFFIGNMQNLMKSRSRGVVGKYLFDKFPTHAIRRAIKPLVREALQSNEFSEEDRTEDRINELCDCGKLVYYEETTQIVTNGNLINEAILVVMGNLRDDKGESLDNRFYGRELLQRNGGRPVNANQTIILDPPAIALIFSYNCLRDLIKPKMYQSV